jgi:hypothetical protein
LKLDDIYWKWRAACNAALRAYDSVPNGEHLFEETDVYLATEDISKLTNEMIKWRTIAFYFASCQVASLWHVKGRKSSSKAEVRRHGLIVEKLIRAFNGELPRVNETQDEILERLKEALEAPSAGSERK